MDPAKTQLLAQEAWVTTEEAYRGVCQLTRETCEPLENKLRHNMGFFGILRWTAMLIDSVDITSEEEPVKAVIALVSTIHKQEWPAVPYILAKLWKGAFNGLNETKSVSQVYHEGQQTLWRTAKSSDIIITIQERVGIKGSEVIILVESLNDDHSMTHFPLDVDEKAKTGRLPATTPTLRKGESMCSCGYQIERSRKGFGNC